MSFHEQHDLAAAYALGALDANEAAAFESHLDSCDHCRRDVIQYSGVVEELAEADAIVPPPELRSRLLDEIARTPQVGSAERSGPRGIPANGDSADGGSGQGGQVVDLTDARDQRAERRPGRWLLTAAAALAIVVGGAAALLTLSDTGDEYDNLAAAADAETLELDSDIGTVTLVYSSEQDQVGVQSIDLADPGEGKTYELWLVVDDGVAPAGLFTPDEGTIREVLSVDDIETQGFGITIEPEGGSDQPTGDILFLGTFGA